MPELPEVEIAARGLRRWLVGRSVVEVGVHDVKVVRRKLSTLPSDAVEDGTGALRADWLGRRVSEVRRVGKRMALVGNGPRALLVHLGMSGKWVTRDAEVPVKHGRVALTLDDGQVVWFVDPRRFGCVIPVDRDEVDTALAKGLGPDALDTPLAANELQERMQTRSAIKVALMDQQRLAGLGNIHAVEALWRAGVDPRRASSSLDAAEWRALARRIPEQLQWTLDHEGDGEMNYINEAGVDNPFAVYAREGEPCRRCGDAIARVVQSGRSTFWCPGCQA